MLDTRAVKYWDEGIVPVYFGFDRAANQNTSSNVVKALLEIQKKTCVK